MSGVCRNRRARVLVSQFLLVGCVLYMGASGLPKAIGEDAPALKPFPDLLIGPVDGLSAAWHVAPERTSIPLGSSIEFFQEAPPDSIVIWTGAEETSRDGVGSISVCHFDEVGQFAIEVRVLIQGLDSFRGQIVQRCVCDVVEIDPADIVVSPVNVWVEPVEIDDSLPPEELNPITMAYYFGESIAGLDQRPDGSYLTSVNRTLQLEVEVDPPGFEPLIEWRFNGQSRSADIGTYRKQRIREKGVHFISVGPIANSREITIETYDVVITSHTSNEDIVPEGEPIVFEAVTDPPGYEDRINWLGSTYYGATVPVTGQGPVFVVEFTDTVGPHPNDGSMWQWLGVKVDNTVFNQDQKQGCCWICIGDQLFCAAPVFRRDCDEVNGWTWVEGKNCGTEACGTGQCNNKTP